MKKDCVLDAVSSQPTLLTATARGRCLPAGLVANRMPLCAVRRAASGGSARPCTRVWTFGATRKPAGTWAAACPWRRWSARGGLRSVPTEGAHKGRWATAGLETRLRAATACSGAGLTGAPRRPALRALRSALVGVQPTTGYGPRPSGPGKAAASSRYALPLRRASVVTSAKRTATRSERASDDAATASRPPAQVVGTQRRTQLFGVVLPARWSGAKWCQCSTVRFSSENLLRSDDRRQQAEIRNGGLLWKLGGCCIPALW